MCGGNFKFVYKNAKILKSRGNIKHNYHSFIFQPYKRCICTASTKHTYSRTQYGIFIGECECWHNTWKMCKMPCSSGFARAINRYGHIVCCCDCYFHLIFACCCCCCGRFLFFCIPIAAIPFGFPNGFIYNMFISYAATDYEFKSYSMFMVSFL